MRAVAGVALAACVVLAGCGTTATPAVTVTATEMVDAPVRGLTSADRARIDEYADAGECEDLRAQMRFHMAAEVAMWTVQGDAWGSDGDNHLGALAYLDAALDRAGCY